MNFRATWDVLVEEPLPSPSNSLFGSKRTRTVKKKASGWIVGATSVSRDIQGMTFRTEHYVAVLPDGEKKLMFLASDKVLVEAMST
jgi:hypothetical protein